MPDATLLRAVPFLLDGERFVARGAGVMSDVVARSVSRRVTGIGLTLWPSGDAGLYRAQWFDNVRDVFCEAHVVILAETALA